jgi:hypothetical protein
LNKITAQDLTGIYLKFLALLFKLSFRKFVFFSTHAQVKSKIATEEHPIKLAQSFQNFLQIEFPQEKKEGEKE